MSTTTPDGAAAGAEPKKSKKKMMIIIAVVLIVAVGYFMMGKKKATAKDAPPVPGVVVAMDATTMNLADGHFLKLKLALQTIKGVKAEEVDTSEAADIALNEFSNRPMATMVTSESREKIKADLLAKLKKAYPKEVMNVFFTEFVMQ
jgi:flagellar FliL protein